MAINQKVPIAKTSHQELSKNGKNVTTQTFDKKKSNRTIVLKLYLKKRTNLLSIFNVIPTQLSVKIRSGRKLGRGNGRRSVFSIKSRTAVLNR